MIIHRSASLITGVPSRAASRLCRGSARLVITRVFCRNQIIGFLMTSKHRLSHPFFFSLCFPPIRGGQFAPMNYAPGDRSRPRFRRNLTYLQNNSALVA